MAEIIFLKFYTLEKNLKKCSSNFQNVYMILCIFGIFYVKNYKVEEIKTFQRNRDLIGTQIGKKVPIGPLVP